MSAADGHTYDSRQKLCFIIPAVVTLLAIITYAARVFTRIKIVKIFGPEDWLCLVAVCASVVLTALVFAETYYGMGLHVADINPATASTMYKVGISGALRDTHDSADMRNTALLGFCLDIQHRLNLHEDLSAYTIYAPVRCLFCSHSLLDRPNCNRHLWAILCVWKYLFVYTGGTMVEQEPPRSLL